ncbi:hypothetical protein PMI07_000381 [Rhizobium sp. CF080]|nr:hypothetical protein PMI07_000381 [Rhizobium sp. CF080]
MATEEPRPDLERNCRPAIAWRGLGTYRRAISLRTHLMTSSPKNLDIGYDVPASVGDTINDIQTPALIIDLDAFERNVGRMKAYAEAMGVRLRPHAKTHKSQMSRFTRWQTAEPSASAARKYPRRKHWCAVA